LTRPCNGRVAVPCKTRLGRMPVAKSGNSARGGSPQGHRLGESGGARGEMRAIVTCECCGYRQAVARPIRRPEQFHVICHGCEGVLLVEVTTADLRQAHSPATSRAPHAAGGVGTAV
jgi:hypothetical protein